MGTGFHGGFGNTIGKRLEENKKAQTNDNDRVNYFSRNEILRNLTGITNESTIIANDISNKKIKLNILGDDLFDYDEKITYVNAG